MSTLGLVLTGGGARGAYQVGVLKGLSQILRQNPGLFHFDVLLGQSAGAINCGALASSPHAFSEAVDHLESVWMGLTSDQIYSTNTLGISRNGLKWLKSAAFGAISDQKLDRALLDNEPLRKLLEKEYSSAQVEKNIESGELRAFGVTAYDYTHLCSTAFFTSRTTPSYAGHLRRQGVNTRVELEHVLGSSSIPLIFPPTQCGDIYLGDGTMRNSSPLSPALHFGSTHLFIVGVRSLTWENAIITQTEKPSVGRILGIMLNSLFFDATDADIQKMQYLNALIRAGEATSRFQEVPLYYTQPSRDIPAIAHSHSNHLPRLIHYLLSSLGSEREMAELTSYLLFEKPYIQELIELGREDVERNGEAIYRFFESARSNKESAETPS